MDSLVSRVANAPKPRATAPTGAIQNVSDVRVDPELSLYLWWPAGSEPPPPEDGRWEACGDGYLRFVGEAA